MPWSEWALMLSTWHFFSDRLTVENVDARPNFSLRVTCVLNTVDQLDFNRVSSRSVFTTVCLLIRISKVSNKIYTIYFITLGIKKSVSELDRGKTSTKAFQIKTDSPLTYPHSLSNDLSSLYLRKAYKCLYGPYYDMFLKKWNFSQGRVLAESFLNS